MKGNQRYVAYYRVSTARQGASGLGLEAQREAVRSYLEGRGWPPIKEFTEVESGKRADRPQLAAALEACRLHRATLVIAKLDRLARNAAFLLNLQEAGVEFVCCDMPDANRMTIGILAVVAEAEAKAISDRTKAALAAAKARGVKLGTAGRHNLKNRRLGRKRGSAANARKADELAQLVAPTILPLRQEGMSLRGIAKRLNAEMVSTERGGQWGPSQVKRVLDRLGG